MTFQPATQMPMPAGDLLYYAALLSGLGPGAQRAAAELTAPLRTMATDGRTCIDGGSSLVFSFLAPGGRNLQVLTRCGPAQDSVLPWLRTSYLPGGKVARWRTETYVGELLIAWAHACAAAERAGSLEVLRRIHALLGPHSRLYSVSWSVDDAAPEAWVGWQLDRTLSIDQALAAVGYSEVWGTAATLWESLLGCPPHPRRGPWSLNLLLGREPRLRVGSTNWARQIEVPEKRRRLATLVERLHGDRRFAEALYKLVECAAGSSRSRPIGRAMELEFVDSRVEVSEFYLCVP